MRFFRIMCMLSNHENVKQNDYFVILISHKLVLIKGGNDSELKQCYRNKEEEKGKGKENFKANRFLQYEFQFQSRILRILRTRTRTGKKSRK